MRIVQHELKWIAPLALAAAALSPAPGAAATLFYNGDANSTQGNFLDCHGCRAPEGVKIYDDFQIAAGQQWDLTALYGNYITQSQYDIVDPSMATWEIRQGISQGNSGTLLASGDASLTVTPQGLSNGLFEYTMQVDIPALNLGPGQYWMTLAPDFTSVETFVDATSGTNGVNQITDGQSYVAGWVFTPIESVGGYLHQFTGQSNYDFSYGIVGTETSTLPTPEPASYRMIVGALAIAASAGLGKLRQRRMQ
jgi:hypothetical protein